MFKRIIWMGTGAAMGAGSAFWAKRKVTRTVERYLPDEVARRARASARTAGRHVGRTVRDAASEGRTAMREREAELQAQADARTLVGPRGPAAERSKARATASPAERRAWPVAPAKQRLSD